MTPKQLEAKRRKLPDLIYRRCRHIVTENARVLEAERALGSGDLVACGRAMNASHLLRDDFEITCPEVDMLAGLAQTVKGVYGSRMTGGGFGVARSVSSKTGRSTRRRKFWPTAIVSEWAGMWTSMSARRPTARVSSRFERPRHGEHRAASRSLAPSLQSADRGMGPGVASPRAAPLAGPARAENGAGSARPRPQLLSLPGNLRVGGARNPDYPHTFVFDNDFQALQADAPTHVESDGLLVAEGELGRCRVLCFSPRHDLTLAGMAVADIERVVDVWVEETIAFGNLRDIASVQIFEIGAK